MFDDVDIPEPPTLLDDGATRGPLARATGDCRMRDCSYPEYTDLLAAHPHVQHVYLASGACLPLRPVPKSAQYRTPVDGLYFCGAGCHPGGGLMGSAGRNAANVVLAG